MVMSEFEIRQQIQAIEKSSELPITKARKLLKICRPLKNQLRTLQQGKLNKTDAESAQRLQRLDRHMRILIEDLRLAALKVLTTRKKKKLGYNTTPTYGGPVFSSASTNETKV